MVRSSHPTLPDQAAEFVVLEWTTTFWTISRTWEKFSGIRFGRTVPLRRSKFPFKGRRTLSNLMEDSKESTADGFSLDDKRTPIDANDIPDVLAKWPNREEGPNSYRVPIEKIRENDWSLAAGRYKPGPPPS